MSTRMRARKVVVLPVPGPPVSTDTLCVKADLTAACCCWDKSAPDVATEASALGDRKRRSRVPGISAIRRNRFVTPTSE